MKKKLVTFMMLGVLGAAFLTGCQNSNTLSNDAEGSAKTEASADAQESAPADSAQTVSAEPEVGDAGSAEEAPAVNLEGHTLMIYCGAGMTQPFQEIADAFQEDTGCTMNVTFANAGQIQSQITASEEGDFFIAGSGDELEPVSDYVSESTDLVKHIPVLAVQAGNPKNITCLNDLTNDGVTLIIGDPESTPIGKIANKALTNANIMDQVSIQATTTTAPQMATAIAAGEADAAIVWKENCNADGVEIVDTTDMDKYIKTIPAASLTCSADAEAVKEFNAYLSTQKAKDIWLKYGYEIVE